jgi:hypothetical protein
MRAFFLQKLRDRVQRHAVDPDGCRFEIRRREELEMLGHLVLGCCRDEHVGAPGFLGVSLCDFGRQHDAAHGDFIERHRYEILDFERNDLFQFCRVTERKREGTNEEILAG